MKITSLFTSSVRAGFLFLVIGAFAAPGHGQSKPDTPTPPGEAAKPAKPPPSVPLPVPGGVTPSVKVPQVAARPPAATPGDNRIIEDIIEPKLNGDVLAHLYREYTGRRVIISAAASAAELRFVQPASPKKPLTYAQVAELLKKAATLANFVIAPDPQDPELDIITLTNEGAHPAVSSVKTNPTEIQPNGIRRGGNHIVEDIIEPKLSGNDLAQLYRAYTGRRVIVSPAASAAEFAFIQPASPKRPLTYAKAAELLKKTAALANFIIATDPQDPLLDIITLVSEGAHPAVSNVKTPSAKLPASGIPLGENKIVEDIIEPKLSGNDLAQLYRAYTGCRVTVSPTASTAEFAFIQPASPNEPLTFAKAAELLKKTAALSNLVITPDAQDPDLDVITLAVVGAKTPPQPGAPSAPTSGARPAAPAAVTPADKTIPVPVRPSSPSPLPTEVVNPLDDYTVIGVSPIRIGYCVTLTKKKNTRERIIVDSGDPSSEFKILEVIRKVGDPLGTVVRLSYGPITGTIGFDEKYLTLGGAQKAPPVASSAPVPVGKPETNPQPAVQPRPRVVSSSARGGTRSVPPVTTLTQGDYTYVINADGQATITGFNHKFAGALVIIDTLGGCPVTCIDSRAFADCKGLTHITIPAGVTNISVGTFFGCTGLTAISVDASNENFSSADGVLFNKKINKLILCPFGKIGSYVIPASVTTIKSSDFRNCTSLTSITIPASVINIEGNAFSHCTGLANIAVDAANENFSSANGVLFDKKKTKLILCPSGKAGSYVIPSSVTSIRYLAFSGCTSLTRITIPSSITSIGNSAFSDCTGLTSITIPSSVTSIRINAFSGCTGLTRITIPSSVTSIESDAFFGCAALTSVTLPVGVTSIGESAFAGCTGLNRITIPSSVTSIGIRAFGRCTGLTSITIPVGVTSIGDTPFAGCTSLTAINVDTANVNYSSADGILFNKKQTQLLQYPSGKTGNYTIPSNVTSIGTHAFIECVGLTGVTIPSSVTSIGYSAFCRCTGLTSVTIPDSVVYIGDNAFVGCKNLPASITIGNRGFVPETTENMAADKNKYINLDGVLFNKDQTMLMRCLGEKTGSYAIPSGVTKILGWGFSRCTGLTSITIPSSVTTIGRSAFPKCTGLTAINVDMENTNYSSADGVLLNKKQTQLLRFPSGKAGTYTIPNSVVSIMEGAFSNCPGLTNVTIPASVSGIGEVAFSHCSGLTSVTLPAGVTYIGKDAFSGCSSLTSVTIPVGVINIESKVFSDCTGLTRITIPDSVTSIGDKAFSGCAGLTRITIPDSVTNIEYEAFARCTNLTAIAVDAANGNYSSLDGVLFDKMKTKLIRCPTGRAGSYVIPVGVISIERNVFSDCTGLNSITIPSSVTSIGWDAFSGCAGLPRITIPDSVTSIKGNAFSGCTVLTAIAVDEANENYSSLNGVLFDKMRTKLIRCPAGKAGSYVIPSSVTSIDEGAFEGCAGLTNVTIPDSVTTIGTDAFEGCTNLPASIQNRGTSSGSSRGRPPRIATPPSSIPPAAPRVVPSSPPSGASPQDPPKPPIRTP